MVDISAYDPTVTTVTSGVVTGIAVVCTGLRFYVRVHGKAGVAWDDWWILAGLLSYLLTGGVNVDPVAETAISEAIVLKTTSSFDTRPHTLYLKISLVCTVLYFTCVTAIKVSILLMYRRIFSIDVSFRIQSLLLGIVVLAFWVAATIATIFNCNPVRYNWDAIVPAEYCFNFNIFWMATGAAEVVIDTFILALPVRMVLGLKVSIRQKISIVLIFLLGSFVIVTGILRVIYGYIVGSRAPQYGKSGLWSTVHILMGIICACLPTLRPLLASFFSLVSTASSTLRRRYQGLSGQDYKRSTGISDSGIAGCKSGDHIEIFPLRQQESFANMNSSREAAHMDIEAISSMPSRHGCHCDAGLNNKNCVEVEAVPRPRHDCSCDASMNDEAGVGEEIQAEVVSAPAPARLMSRRRKDCGLCGSIVKQTRVEIQSEPIRLGDCSCAAAFGSRDLGRNDSVHLPDRERGW